jgi:hypothetical protein
MKRRDDPINGVLEKSKQHDLELPRKKYDPKRQDFVLMYMIHVGHPA